MGLPKTRLLVSITILSIISLLAVACGGSGEQVEELEPTKAPQVVVFSTQPPQPPTATPTPSPSPTVTPTPHPEPVEEATPTPELIVINEIPRQRNENPLTGLIVDPSVFERRPVHVRIGNDEGARPQVGLSQADIVYEEIVEWWITRFTAIFYTNAPEMVAPIRSARLINTELTQQYDAALVNSGGSDPVRWQLSQLPIVNLDEYFHPTPYFYRPNENWQRRLAINIAELHTYMAEEGLEAPVQLRGFVFSEEPPAGEPAETLYIDYPSAQSKVMWRFNAETNLYERYVAGAPMIDEMTGEVIAVPNVIVYFTEHYETDIVEDSTGATSVGLHVNGIGDAWIFRDGLIIKGTWLTDGSQTPSFLDGVGQNIPLHPGQTWIQVVPADYEILINEEPA